MIKIFKALFVAGFLILFISTGSRVAIAAGMEEPINNTIAHLEAALKAVNANEPEVAQQQIKDAGQTSKSIFGGSFESKKQRGSKAIANARREMKEGNPTAAAVSLNEALEVFKSLLRPFDAGSQGGLK